jgi:hypothetical protein
MLLTPILLISQHYLLGAIQEYLINPHDVIALMRVIIFNEKRALSYIN